MLKKIICPVLTLFSLTTHATELKTFSEMANAVSQGSELRFVASLKSCQANFPLNDIKVSVKPSTIMLIADKQVTASKKHFTLNKPGFSGVPVIDYVKYIINADGSSELHMTSMDARDFHVLSNYKINCELGSGLQAFNITKD